MKASTWTHPTTGEVRVYFNGVHQATSRGIKVFASKIEGTGQRPDYFHIKLSEKTYPQYRDAIINEVDFELRQLNGGEDVNHWNVLLNVIA